MAAIEVIAVVLALVYVVLASLNSPWCWPFAFVSSALVSYQVWFAYRLLFDAGLNIFYAAMAVVGLWRWQTRRAARGPERVKPITALSLREHAYIIAGGLAVSLLCGVLAQAYTKVSFPYLDALTTVFSVVGTFLLVERKLENWLYLLAMDVLYVYLYSAKGSALFAGLFVVYTLLAGVGYYNWRRLRMEAV